MLYGLETRHVAVVDGGELEVGILRDAFVAGGGVPAAAAELAQEIVDRARDAVAVVAVDVEVVSDAFDTPLAGGEGVLVAGGGDADVDAVAGGFRCDRERGPGNFLQCGGEVAHGGVEQYVAGEIVDDGVSGFAVFRQCEGIGLMRHVSLRFGR